MRTLAFARTRMIAHVTLLCLRTGPPWLQEQVTTEKHMTTLHSKKIGITWRKIMRMAKTEQLKKDLDIVARMYFRDIDRQDAVLQMILRDIESAEEQTQHANRQHAATLAKLMEVQDTRLAELEVAFADVIAERVAKGEEERAAIIEQHMVARNEVRHILKAHTEEEADKREEAQTQHEAAREELNATALERIHYLQSILDSRIEELENAFEAAHTGYMQNTEQRTQDYRVLLARGDKLAQSIESKRARVQHLKRELQRWRVKLAINHKDESSRNEHMLAEKESMRVMLSTLKSSLRVKRATSQQRLTVLSSQAQAAKQVASERATIAESVLALAERARMLETRDELVAPGCTARDVAAPCMVPVPGGSASPTAASATFRVPAAAVAAAASEDHVRSDEYVAGAEAVASQMKQEAQDTLSSIKAVAPAMRAQPVLHEPERDGTSAVMLDHENEAVSEVDALANFFRRYNNALLQKLALDSRRAELREENVQLQASLQQFVEGVTLQPHTLHGDNTLMVVNGRTNAIRPPVRAAPVSVTDGVQLMASAALSVRRVR